MANAPVCAEVHQPLDIHRYLPAQVALDRKHRNGRAQLRNLGLGQVLDLGLRRNAGCIANVLRAGVSDTVDRRQCNHDVLVQRNIYACYTCH